MESAFPRPKEPLPNTGNLWHLWSTVLRSLAILAALAATALCSEAADLIVDEFNYTSDAEARAAWRSSSLNPDVAMGEGEPWGERVMLLPCPFTADVPRAYWDRDVVLDLTDHHAIALEIFVPDPGAIQYFTLYLRVSDGWYFNSFSLPDTGWNSIRLPLGDFATSSATVPLEQVEGIRLSPWKGAGIDTTLAVGELRLFTPGILLTEGLYGDHVPAM